MRCLARPGGLQRLGTEAVEHRLQCIGMQGQTQERHLRGRRLPEGVQNFV